MRKICIFSLVIAICLTTIGFSKVPQNNSAINNDKSSVTFLDFKPSIVFDNSGYFHDEENLVKAWLENWLANSSDESTTILEHKFKKAHATEYEDEYEIIEVSFSVKPRKLNEYLATEFNSSLEFNLDGEWVNYDNVFGIVYHDKSDYSKTTHTLIDFPKQSHNSVEEVEQIVIDYFDELIKTPYTGKPTKYTQNKLEFENADERFVLDISPGSYNEWIDSGTLRVTKYDSLDKKIWSKDYPEFPTSRYLSDMPYGITSDGGFVAVTEIDNSAFKPFFNISNTKAYLVKFDANGNVEWKTIHDRSTNIIKIITEGENGDLYTYGYSHDEQKAHLQLFDKNGQLKNSKFDVNIHWSELAHYRNGLGWIISGPNTMACYDNDLNELWFLGIMGVDARAKYFEDVIYWGGGGQSWMGAPIHKVSYDGKIIWEKDFGSITRPIKRDFALVLAEGEDARGIKLVNMETEKEVTEIPQLKYNFYLDDCNQEQFTLAFFDRYSKILLTYDYQGNVINSIFTSNM